MARYSNKYKHSSITKKGNKRLITFWDVKYSRRNPFDSKYNLKKNSLTYEEIKLKRR